MRKLWWYTPLIPELGRQWQVALSVPDLGMKFQNSHDCYTATLCPKTKWENTWPWHFKHRLFNTNLEIYNPKMILGILRPSIVTFQIHFLTALPLLLTFIFLSLFCHLNYTICSTSIIPYDLFQFLILLKPRGDWAIPFTTTVSQVAVSLLCGKPSMVYLLQRLWRWSPSIKMPQTTQKTVFVCLLYGLSYCTLKLGHLFIYLFNLWTQNETVTGTYQCLTCVTF